MAKSLEDLEESMEELELRMTCRFDALKEFTLKTLKEMRLEQELETMNDSIGSLKEEFESFKTKTLAEGHSKSLTKEETKKRESDAIEGNNKRLFRGFTFYPMSSTPVRGQPIATTLAEVRDPKLKESLQRFYTEDNTQCGKMTALQYAYFQMFYLEKKNGYSGKRSVIEELIKDGVRDGIWAEDFVPAGVKNGFFEYLRDKAKNKQKKKLSEEAMVEFAEEYANL